MKTQYRLIQHFARFIVKRHKWIVIGSLVLFVLSMVSANRIVMRTQLKDMIRSENPKVKSWNRLVDEFSTVSTIILTVEGPDKQAMIDAAEALAQEIEASEPLKQYVSNVNLKVDREFIINWGLLLQEAKDLDDMRDTFASLNLLPFVTALNDNFEKVYTGDEAEEDITTNKDEAEAVAFLNQLDLFATQLRVYLEDSEAGNDPDQARELTETFLFGDTYGFDPDYTMLLFTLRPTFPPEDIDSCMASVGEIRKIMASVQPSHPDVEFGYAGELAANYDEMTAANYDMLVPALVALLIILVLLALSFSQIRLVVFAVIALLVGIVYDAGIIGITIGYLNTITSFFGVLLVGLGIDFGLHIVSNFNDFRALGYSPEDAVIHTLEKTGIPVMLGALTTAVAFFSLALSGYIMFEQFGLVAGCGILTCLATMLILLPAMMLWFGRKVESKKLRKTLNYQFLATLGSYASQAKWPVLIVCLVATLVLAYFIPQNAFEYEFLKLGPQQTVAYRMQRKILERFDLSPFPSMVATDSVEGARQLTEALEEELVVAQVSSISQFLPAPEAQAESLKVIAELHAMLPRYDDRVYTAEEIEMFADEIQRLEWNIIEIGDLSVAGLGEDNKIVKKRNQIIREIFGVEVGKPGKETFQQLITLLKSDPERYAQRLSSLDASFAREMDRYFSQMTAVNRQITLADLPDYIINEYANATNTQFKITLFPKGNVFKDRASLVRFTTKMDKVSERITGAAPLAFILMDDMLRGARDSAIIVAVVIFVLLLVSFRSFKYTLLGFGSLMIGMVWMFGLFPLIGLKFHFINIIVLPLIIGIGIDYAIHVVDRTRLEQSLETALRFSGKAILLSAVTTMIGFGSLGLIGSYQGISDIGRTLFFGILTCLISALILLPALLAVADRKQLKH